VRISRTRHGIVVATGEQGELAGPEIDEPAEHRRIDHGDAHPAQLPRDLAGLRRRRCAHVDEELALAEAVHDPLAPDRRRAHIRRPRQHGQHDVADLGHEARARRDLAAGLHQKIARGVVVEIVDLDAKAGMEEPGRERRAGRAQADEAEGGSGAGLLRHFR
jgi:hypothetical protein